LAKSTLVLTQLPEQQVGCVGGHAWPHAPQWASSLAVSTQTPPQHWVAPPVSQGVPLA
jgi:hypothetical protein